MNLDTTVGQAMSDEQWDRAALPVRLGGVGLREYRSCVDSAYVASRMMADSRMTAVSPRIGGASN